MRTVRSMQLFLPKRQEAVTHQYKIDRGLPDTLGERGGYMSMTSPLAKEGRRGRIEPSHVTDTGEAMLCTQHSNRMGYYETADEGGSCHRS